MKRKVRLRLDVYQRDLAGEKLAPEVEAIALGRIDLAHRSAAKLVISGPILQCRFGAVSGDKLLDTTQPPQDIGPSY